MTMLTGQETKRRDGDERRRRRGDREPEGADRSVDNSEKETPPGVPGEILTQGSELFLGYHDPSLDAEAFSNGWFRTGDIGALDADGYLTITGRRKDIIIRKGENISAKEVENLLAEHPAIYQASVIGLPDPTRGERVCAVVVPKSNSALNLADLAQWLATQGIARQKIPEQLEIVDALPMTPTGKIRKNELRTRFSNVPI